jgi:4-amino-4-deoxy-L-arabinose transferase-like glycosyltransferase
MQIRLHLNMRYTSSLFMPTQVMPTQEKRPLIAILLIFTLLTGLTSWLIPPFEGPDSPEHFAYIEWLAQGKGWPPQGEAAWDTAVRQEASQPPLYYLLAAAPTLFIDVAAPPAVYRPNPYFPSSAPGNIPDNKNIAIHYPTDTNPLGGGWLSLYLARGLSFLSGIALIVTIYKLTQQIEPQLALPTAAFVAMTPQVIFLSGVVSNDVLTAVTATATLTLLIRISQHGFTSQRALTLGILYGLAALTKTSNLTLGLPIAIVWLMAVRKPHFWRMGVILAGATAVTAGWWYLRTWALYGSPFGLDTHCFAPWAYCDTPALRHNPLQQWREVFDSFWAAFGWGNIKWPGWIYGLWGIFVLTGVGGLLMARRRQQHNRTILGILLLILLVMAVSLDLWMRQVTAPHGRLLFPALAAIAIPLIIGWHTISPRLPWLAVGLMALWTITSLVFLIRPAYARPHQLDDVTDAIGWRFGEMVELVSVEPLLATAVAGQTLPIKTCWRTLGATNKDNTLLLHIIGPHNGVIAGRHTYPGLGSFPTSQWPADYAFCDTIRLDIPADLAQTLLYKVEVGWLDESGQRVTAVDNTNTPLTTTFAATIRLQIANYPIIQLPNYPITQLPNYQLPAAWHINQPNSFTLQWAFTQAVSTDYTTFVHLRDTQTGQNVAQADGPPLDGWYPTSQWQPGEIITDERTFPLPDTLTPGTYTLVVGWYDPLTGERFGPEFPLGDVEVQP